MGLAQKKVYYIGGNTVMKKEEYLHTIEDIEALPEGERAELIDGKMYMMASPTATHQRILFSISNAFYKYIKSNRGKCEAFFAPFAVYLNEKDTYVEPDFVVVCDKDKMDEKGCHGGPNLVVEIVSPGSIQMDYVIKLFQYRMYGVHEYWIVDIEKKRIQVYDFANEDMKEYTFEDKVPVGIYNGDLEIDFAECSVA